MSVGLRCWHAGTVVQAASLSMAESKVRKAVLTELESNISSPCHSLPKNLVTEKMLHNMKESPIQKPYEISL